MKNTDNAKHRQRYGATSTLYLLLVGVFIATTILENSLAIFFKAEHMHTKWFRDSPSEYVLNRNDYIFFTKKCAQKFMGTLFLKNQIPIPYP